MWYFAWILGTAFACSFAVFNALWLEISFDEDKDVSTY
jgi:cytochrome bd-I ubiquinol oxidase subunit X